MDYAIIRLGNKQHRVRDGETLVVDRLPTEEGKTFQPDVLLGDLAVTATVLSHGRGPKILIGKYRKRTGYKRHIGFRAATTRVEITLGAGSGAKRKTAVSKAAATEAPPAKESKPETAKSEELAQAPEPATPESPAGSLPEGYATLTVAQISAAARSWSHSQLEGALAYEAAHAARKGAIAALSAALAKGEN